MNSLHKQFIPLTATPFFKSEFYQEYRPVSVLQPFIACFWVQKGGSAVSDQEEEQTLVTPDGCMDLIFRIDSKSEQTKCLFVGINDEAFLTDHQAASSEVFAIRFYFWAVHLFVDDTLKNSCNIIAEADQYFPKWCSDLREQLHGDQALEQRIRFAEQFLIEKLNQAKLNYNLLNAVDVILHKKGNLSVEEICGYTSISQRQMERVFREQIGITMKKTAGLMRYQNVWKDQLMNPKFDIQSCVFEYGYTDQSHLLKEFKRFHGMRLSQAKKYAMSVFYYME